MICKKKTVLFFSFYEFNVFLFSLRVCGYALPNVVQFFLCYYSLVGGTAAWDDRAWQKAGGEYNLIDPVAALAPLSRRPLCNEERHNVMRDGIPARMWRDKTYSETAARLCQLYMEAGNSFALVSRLIVGNTLLLTRVDLLEQLGMSGAAAAAFCVQSLAVDYCSSDESTTHVIWLQQLKRENTLIERSPVLNSAVTHWWRNCFTFSYSLICWTRVPFLNSSITKRHNTWRRQR